MFPLTKNFRATSLFKAFLLNALAAAFIASIAIEIRLRLNNEKDSLYILLNKWIPGKQVNDDILFMVTFVVSFVACLLVYNTLFILFLFGGGMLAPNEKVKYF